MMLLRLDENRIILSKNIQTQSFQVSYWVDRNRWRQGYTGIDGHYLLCTGAIGKVPVAKYQSS